MVWPRGELSQLATNDDRARVTETRKVAQPKIINIQIIVGHGANKSLELIPDVPATADRDEGSSSESMSLEEVKV